MARGRRAHPQLKADRFSSYGAFALAANPDAETERPLWSAGPAQSLSLKGPEGISGYVARRAERGSHPRAERL